MTRPPCRTASWVPSVVVVVLNVAPLLEANRAVVPGLAVADKLSLAEAVLGAVQW